MLDEVRAQAVSVLVSCCCCNNSDHKLSTKQHELLFSLGLFLLRYILLLIFLKISEVPNTFHWAKITVQAGVNSFLEALGENYSLGPFQLL